MHLAANALRPNARILLPAIHVERVEAEVASEPRRDEGL
jgi:hypothetical protein